MQKVSQQKKLIRIFCVVLFVFALVITAWTEANAETSIPVSAKINAPSGANIRLKASTTSKRVAYCKNNKSIKINYEIFLSSTSTKSKKIWYNVTVSGKTGFVRKDLVDNRKYTAVAGKTTDALNYRVGAGAEMKLVGTLKKGAKVNVVAIAYAKNTSDKWYKIKKGTKYYYVSAYWVELSTAEEVTQKDPEPVSSEKASFTTTGVTTPTLIAYGCKFAIIGTIECNLPMTELKVGVINTSNKWETYKTVFLGEKIFDISTVDANIKFGKLSVGSYKYRILAKVNGEWHEVVGKSFSVKKMKSAEKLAACAINLAWPAGTEAALYTRELGGTATPNYQAALDSEFPSNSTSNFNVGADCGKYIATVCRYCGYDKELPADLSKMRAHLAESEKWQEVDYTFAEGELQSGDILSYMNRSTGRYHVNMYVVIDGKACLAEASNTTTSAKFGFINTSLTKIKETKVSNMHVYRAAS